MDDTSLMEKIAETKEIIAETGQRAMAANRWCQTRSNTQGTENLEAFSPEPELTKADEDGTTVVEEEMETLTGTNVVEADEEALTYAGGSNNQDAGTEKTGNVAPSETTAEEQTPQKLWRPQFGSMSLAEAENYSSWRGSLTI